MKLLCVGLNWKTPVRIRERLAFDGTRLVAALDGLKAAYPALECVILSTCNRTELYAALAEKLETLGVDELCEFLARCQEVPLVEFYDHLYFHEDAGAVLHLFQVAGGLDSLILGEAQIVGQVRQAYQHAGARQTVGPILHALFQRALGAAKRVHTETALTQGRISIASAAVEFIRGVFDSFDDKNLLVIGAGKMAELTLTHLRSLACRGLVVCNRNVARGAELAERFGGRVRPFTELADALTEADIVVSSTGADDPIVGPEQFRPIMAARRNRLMAIIDIAVPRDFHPEVATIENVLLWNIDDLEKVRYKTLRARERELDKALRIVDEETQAFQVVLALQQTGPVIGRLEEEYQQIIDRELAWLMPQLNGVSEESRAKIRQFAHRLKNKFLHPPKAALRAEARGGAPHGLIDAFRKLFAIEE